MFSLMQTKYSLHLYLDKNGFQTEHRTAGNTFIARSHYVMDNTVNNLACNTHSDKTSALAASVHTQINNKKTSFNLEIRLSFLFSTQTNKKQKS